MCSAAIAHKDRLLLDSVTSLRPSRARVDAVPVVETSADAVTLDDLDAHDAGGARAQTKESQGQSLMAAGSPVLGVLERVGAESRSC